MGKARLATFVALSSVFLVAATVVFGLAASAALGGAEKEAPGPGGSATPMVAIAIAVSVASGTLGAGYAVGKVGAAALGAASERPEIIGRALVFVVIAEGIAVWGLVGAILLIGKL